MLSEFVKSKNKTEKEIKEREYVLSQLEKVLKQYEKRQDGYLYIHFKFVLQKNYNIDGDKLLIWLNDDPMPALCLDNCCSKATTEFIDYIMNGQGFQLLRDNNYCCDGISNMRTYYL